MDLKEYIKSRYNDNINDFLETEIDNQQWRVNEVVNNRMYLNGNHKVLQRKSFKYKNKEIESTKLVLQSADKILNFHDTYLLGKRITLNGTDKAVELVGKQYRLGKFNKALFDVKRQVTRFGDCFLYLYKDNNVIKNKIIGADCGYPIFSENTGEYIGFIEHYRIDTSKIAYWNVYYTDRVVKYSDEGGYIQEIGKYNNNGGLPIHFKNYCDYDDRFGKSDLKDLIPIYDQLEDLYSKMVDGVYKLSLNPLGVLTGQVVTNASIDKDMTGAVLNVDVGDFKYATANMDYNTIKLLYDQLKEQLSIIGSVPSTVLGNSNIANVSEVSLGILYQLTESKALEDSIWLREGIDTMHERMLQMLGLDTNNEYIDIVFNYSKIINTNDLVNNLKTLFDMGALSVKTILEKCGYEIDIKKELERLKESTNMVNGVLNNSNENDKKSSENVV